jgi:hypothetical protein
VSKIKDFSDFNINEQTDPQKEWLPEDFDFRDYVDKNMPMLAKRILVPKQIDHVAHLLETLAKEYSGEKSGEEFIEYLVTEKYDKALMEADDINRIAIWVYILFQINKVPLMLREKFKVTK